LTATKSEDSVGASAHSSSIAATPSVRDYYRTVVSSEVFGSLDTYVWKLL
jgi:hypothetical protein